MHLRDYQTRGIEEIRKKVVAGHKSILYVLPCGGGKTVQMGFMATNAAKKGLKTTFTVHRRALIDQSSEFLTSNGVIHGIIAAGYPKSDHLIQVASIQTLARRLKSAPVPDILVVDEAAHSTAKRWSSVIRHYPKALKIGLTATPCRMSGSPLGDIFQTMVEGPSMQALTPRYLSPYTLYGPPSQLNLKGLKTVVGDFEKGMLEELTLNAKITGSAISHYQKFIPGERGIAFCVSIKHSKRSCAGVCPGRHCSSTSGWHHSPRITAKNDIRLRFWRN